MSTGSSDAADDGSSESANSREPLEVYVQSFCPHCKEVTSVLDRMGLEYVSHKVSHSESERDEVEEVSGQRGVPVLVDPNNGIDGMAESTDIVEYLRETYEYPDGVEPKSGLVSRLISNVL